MSRILENNEKFMNILITGLLRTPHLFKKSLSDFSKLKNEKIVKRIIFVTWKDHIPQWDPWRMILKKHEVELIELIPPIGFHGGYWYQTICLDVGLEASLNSDFTLKTRTDVYINVDFIRKLFYDDEYLKISDIKNDIFKRRIWVPWFEISSPFYIADECFYGKNIDLKKLLNYDVSYDFKYPSNFPIGLTHIRRFIHPFLEKYPDLKIYQETYGNNFHVAKNGLELMYEYELLDKSYLRTMAIYYFILKNYFRINSSLYKEQIIFRKHSTPNKLINPLKFSKNFSLANSILSSSIHIISYNEDWLNNLTEKKIESNSDRRLLAFYKEYDLVAQNKKNKSVLSFKKLKELMNKKAIFERNKTERKIYLNIYLYLRREVANLYHIFFPKKNSTN